MEIVIVLFAIVALLFTTLPSIVRGNKDYSGDLKGVLDERGCRLISAKTPRRLFDTGPFPKRELFILKAPRRFFNSPFGSGAFTIYRIVKFIDAHENERESWVKMDFEMNELINVVFDPEINELR